MDGYLYEVTHDDECQGIPCETAKRILVNFWGSLLMKDALEEVEKMDFYVSVKKWIVVSAEDCLLGEYWEEGETEHI